MEQFLKKKSNFEVKKIFPTKNKTKDQINNDTNSNVIKREIGNDLAQIPLKYVAFIYAGSTKLLNKNNKIISQNDAYLFNKCSIIFF